MINYRDQLYAFPKDDMGERYDPVVNRWCTLDLSITRPSKVAVVRGEIYSIEFSTSSTIKKYDNERCSWQTVLSSDEGCRDWSCVVVAGNHLYVCGGMIEGEGVTKAERFDTVENKWEEIANMQENRMVAFGVATEGKIFVAGGMNSTSFLQTCEMFNISTNEWQLIGSLTVERACGSMVCLKGKLYVLGGTKTWGSGLSVECYDPTEDKWIEKTTIPVKMNSLHKEKKLTFSGCVLKLSKGVLDKLDIVKDSKS